MSRTSKIYSLSARFKYTLLSVCERRQPAALSGLGDGDPGTGDPQVRAPPGTSRTSAAARACALRPAQRGAPRELRSASRPAGPPARRPSRPLCTPRASEPRDSGLLRAPPGRLPSEQGQRSPLPGAPTGRPEAERPGESLSGLHFPEYPGALPLLLPAPPRCPGSGGRRAVRGPEGGRRKAGAGSRLNSRHPLTLTAGERLKMENVHHGVALAKPLTLALRNKA